jgi:four helix bundle protein
MISTYKDLVVWQRSMELVVAIYKLTDNFPKSELYGLTSQIRRSAVSLPSNIAEGRYRGGKKEYTQFLRIAYASGAELETQLELAARLNLNKDNSYTKINSLLTEVMKMLNVIIRKINPSEAN